MTSSRKAKYNRIIENRGSHNYKAQIELAYMKTYPFTNISYVAPKVIAFGEQETSVTAANLELRAYSLSPLTIVTTLIGIPNEPLQIENHGTFQIPKLTLKQSAANIGKNFWNSDKNVFYNLFFLIPKFITVPINLIVTPVLNFVKLFTEFLPKMISNLCKTAKDDLYCAIYELPSLDFKNPDQKTGKLIGKYCGYYTLYACVYTLDAVATTWDFLGQAATSPISNIRDSYNWGVKWAKKHGITGWKGQLIGILCGGVSSFTTMGIYAAFFPLVKLLALKTIVSSPKSIVNAFKGTGEAVFKALKPVLEPVGKFLGNILHQCQPMFLKLGTGMKKVLTLGGNLNKTVTFGLHKYQPSLTSMGTGTFVGMIATVMVFFKTARRIIIRTREIKKIQSIRDSYRKENENDFDANNLTSISPSSDLGGYVSPQPPQSYTYFTITNNSHRHSLTGISPSTTGEGTYDASEESTKEHQKIKTTTPQTGATEVTVLKSLKNKKEEPKLFPPKYILVDKNPITEENLQNSLANLLPQQKIHSPGLHHYFNEIVGSRTEPSAKPVNSSSPHLFTPQELKDAIEGAMKETAKSVISCADEVERIDDLTDRRPLIS